MDRLHLAAEAEAVGADGVDELVGAADLRQQLRGLFAVLLRPLLKVHIVEQAHGGPEVRVLAVAQLLGVPAHGALHRQRVLDVEGFGIVCFQQRQGRFSIRTCSHG